MATANFMNVASVKGIHTQIAASKKLQEENVEAAEIFAGLMNQSMDFSNAIADDSKSKADISKTSAVQSPAESYERYSYRENRIESAKQPDISQKLEETEEVLEQTAEEVIDALCEEYSVDEETLQQMLDDMGLTPLDLLNPQNLVSFLTALTGVASAEELLLDENFLKVMETLNHLADGLMKDLDVDANGLQNLIAEWDRKDAGIEVPAEFQEVIGNLPENGVDLAKEKSEAEHVEGKPVAETEAEPVEEKPMAEAESVEGKPVTEAESVEGKLVTEAESVEEKPVAEQLPLESEAMITTEAETTVEGEAMIITEMQPETEVDADRVIVADEITDEAVSVVVKDEEKLNLKSDSSQQPEISLQDKVSVIKETSEDSALTGENQNSENHSHLNHQTDAGQTLFMNQTVNTVQVNEVPQMQFESYFSSDTVQIMEQIVQQMRVNIAPETTSMEMQLNPENLGKVYVHISSEEGVVNARFHATNEVVREALEAQIATLRENLNQAGVKVDAIEVTIASHEFERNLEQNQQQAGEHTETETAKTASGRRNLTIDSLDELSGLMTEEETLVAQIMKDNGNSVDFTA